MSSTNMVCIAAEIWDGAQFIQRFKTFNPSNEIELHQKLKGYDSKGEYNLTRFVTFNSKGDMFGCAFVFNYFHVDETANYLKELYIHQLANRDFKIRGMANWNRFLMIAQYEQDKFSRVFQIGKDIVTQHINLCVCRLGEE